MQDLNHIDISGNLTQDAELRSTASGTAVLRFRIASSLRKKLNGEWQGVAGFYDVICWGRMGESLAPYLKKGNPVVVGGHIEWRQWEAKDGSKRQTVEIIADHVRNYAPRNADAQPVYDDNIPF